MTAVSKVPSSWRSVRAEWRSMFYGYLILVVRILTVLIAGAAWLTILYVIARNKPSGWAESVGLLLPIALAIIALVERQRRLRRFERRRQLRQGR